MVSTIEPRLIETSGEVRHRAVASSLEVVQPYYVVIAAILTSTHSLLKCGTAMAVLALVSKALKQHHAVCQPSSLQGHRSVGIHQETCELLADSIPSLFCWLPCNPPMPLFILIL